jgi:hypothetical protein
MSKPSRDTIVENICNEILQKRGYLTLATEGDYAVGTIVNRVSATSMGALNHDLVIVAKTDYADHCEQSRCVGKPKPWCPVKMELLSRGRRVMSVALVEREVGVMDLLEGFQGMYSDGDADVRCYSQKVVKTRKAQKCPGMFLEALHDIPAGTTAVVERALLDGKWCSCYTCAACIEKFAERHDNELSDGG